MTYIKPLDSIRAIAVLLVIITHWFPDRNPLYVYTSYFNGVDIFFTLSGFLITKILLENRNKSEKESVSKSRVIKSFFVRRVLRIFPIYYITIFILLLIGPGTETDIRNSYGFFLTYTSNFHFFYKQSWDGMLSHLWSLSVEEQFYLFWPWLMLFLNKKFLLPSILLLFAFGLASQHYLQNIDLGDILTFACFDGFGIGALLAWIAVYQRSLLKKAHPVLLILSIACFGLQIVRVHWGPDPIPSRTLTAICTAWLICYIVIGYYSQLKLMRIILDNKMLHYLGKISYGIYLYHLMTPYLLSGFFVKLNMQLPLKLNTLNFYLVRIENFCLLVLIASLSWIIIEKPFLKLKGRFEYTEKDEQKIKTETAVPV